MFCSTRLTRTSSLSSFAKLALNFEEIFLDYVSLCRLPPLRSQVPVKKVGNDLHVKPKELQVLAKSEIHCVVSISFDSKDEKREPSIRVPYFLSLMKPRFNVKTCIGSIVPVKKLPLYIFRIVINGVQVRCHFLLNCSLFQSNWASNSPASSYAAVHSRTLASRKQF